MNLEMEMVQRSVSGVAVSAWLVMCATVAAGEVRYRLVALEGVGVDSMGLPVARANALSEAGVVTGNGVKQVNGEYLSVGVRWNERGVAEEIGTPWMSATGDADVATVGINGAGEAVGFAMKYVGGVSKGYHPVKWDAAGVATELGGLGVSASGGNDGFAYSIAESGVATGSVLAYLPGVSGRRGVRWGAGSTVATELRPLAVNGNGAGYSAGWGVNSSGVVVGQSAAVVNSQGLPTDRRAVKWAAGSTVAELLATPENMRTPIAYSVSDTGYVVGDGVDLAAYGAHRVMRWDPAGEASVLGWVLADGTQLRDVHAWDVNDAGMVVGMVGEIGVGTRALLWESDGSVVDLNTRIEPGSGWQLAEALGINDHGWIVGVGRLPGDPQFATNAHAFLLIPEKPGDANRDGRVDAEDYARIDRGLAMGLTGWTNGDFSGDGVVDAKDYAVIDAAAQLGAGHVAAIPEPGTFAIALAGVLGAVRRRGTTAVTSSGFWFRFRV